MLDTSPGQAVAWPTGRKRTGIAFREQRRTQTHTSPQAWETWPGQLVRGSPAPCPTDSTLEPFAQASSLGHCSWGPPICRGSLTVAPGSWRCRSPSIRPPGACPQHEARGPQCSLVWVGDLCERWQGYGWGKQMPGVQPLPAPCHTAQSWVCSLHTLPRPIQHARGHLVSSPCLSVHSPRTGSTAPPKGAGISTSPHTFQDEGGKLGSTGEVRMSR